MDTEPQPSYQLSQWLLFGIIGTVAAIFLHEVGHLIPALGLGATNIQIMPTAIEFDPLSVGARDHVIIAVGGLVATLLLTLLAFWGVQRTDHPFYSILGILSQLRGALVAIIYFLFLFLTGENVFTVLGRNGNDEATIAYYSGISLTPIILFSLIMMIIWWPYFWRRLYLQNGWRGISYCLLGCIAGSLFYGTLSAFLSGSF
ncbi:MAG: hypothetical protein AAF614_32285 [Chloroflexota bacterium]